MFIIRWICVGLTIASLSATTFGTEKTKLSEAANKSLNEAFPKATVVKVVSEKDKVLGDAAGTNIMVPFFAVTLRQDSTDMCVHVLPEGLIVEVQTKATDLEILKAGVTKAIKTAVPGGIITNVMKCEVKAMHGAQTMHGPINLSFQKLPSTWSVFVVTVFKQTDTVYVDENGKQIGTAPSLQKTRVHVRQDGSVIANELVWRVVVDPIP